MTVEELLKPRYKVIADYPFSPYKVGDLMQKSFESFYITKSKEYVEGTAVDVEDFVHAKTVDKYPHLFKKLEWWEERGVEVLNAVKYVKVVIYRGYWRVGDIVPASLKINAVLKPIGYTLKHNHFQPVYELEPATLEEYEAFNHKG